MKLGPANGDKGTQLIFAALKVSSAFLESEGCALVEDAMPIKSPSCQYHTALIGNVLNLP